MIDVKEMREDNEATAWEKAQGNRDYGRLAETMFRDPAEMVTISANRFERLIRENDDLRFRLTSYENQLNAISSLVDQEAMKYAKTGRELPSWGDTYEVSKIIHWTEPADIRYVRLDAEQTAKAAQAIKEAANNGEATD